MHNPLFKASAEKEADSKRVIGINEMPITSHLAKGIFLIARYIKAIHTPKFANRPQ